MKISYCLFLLVFTSFFWLPAHLSCVTHLYFLFNMQQNVEECDATKATYLFINPGQKFLLILHYMFPFSTHSRKIRCPCRKAPYISQRRVLACTARHTSTICYKYILRIPDLVITVEHRCLRIAAHARRSHFVDSWPTAYTLLSHVVTFLSLQHRT